MVYETILVMRLRLLYPDKPRDKLHLEFAPWPRTLWKREYWSQLYTASSLHQLPISSWHTQEREITWEPLTSICATMAPWQKCTVRYLRINIMLNMYYFYLKFCIYSQTLYELAVSLQLLYEVRRWEHAEHVQFTLITPLIPSLWNFIIYSALHALIL